MLELDHRRGAAPPGSSFKVKFLHTERRQRVMIDAEFQALLRQCLLVLRCTGARPGEVRELTWDGVDFVNHRFVRPRAVRRSAAFCCPSFAESPRRRAPPTGSLARLAEARKGVLRDFLRSF